MKEWRGSPQSTSGTFYIQEEDFLPCRLVEFVAGFGFSFTREKRLRGQPDARGLCHINIGTAAVLSPWEGYTSECSLTSNWGFPSLLCVLFSLSALFCS